MPARNTDKEYGENCYYHIYNRGANRTEIFHDEEDYSVFLNILKRHLSQRPCFDRVGREYRHLKKDISLLCYCLMPNHFHLLIYNKSKNGIELLMRSLATTYSMYYNKKYKHSGHIFQGVYKASLIEVEQYLDHISRYIHRNPKNYKTYDYSSYKALVGSWDVEWLDKEEFWNIFEGTTEEYKEFLDDYEDFKESIQEISEDLADN